MCRLIMLLSIAGCTALPAAAQFSDSISYMDPLGRKVSTVLSGEKEAGMHAMSFDASGLASGVYLYRLTAGEFVATKKMSVVH